MTPAFDVVFRSAKEMRGFGTTEMRCAQPARFLEAAGLRVSTGSLYQSDLPRCRVLVLHRVPLDEVARRAIYLARRGGAAIVYDTDDFIHDASGTGFDPEIADAMRACDLVSVSGTVLKEEVAALGVPVVVVRNKLSAELLALADRTPTPARTRTPVTIGYFSGSAHHDADFAMIAPALISVLRAHPATRLVIGGKLTVGPEFAALSERVRIEPFKPYAEFLSLFGEVDINLAPLDLTSPLARARSELKYLEAAAFAVPTIASPSRAYQDAITHGLNGLLCGDADWESTLTSLVGEASVREEMGARAREHVVSHYAQSNGVDEWRALFNGLAVAQSDAASTGMLVLPQAALLSAQLLRRGRQTLRSMTQPRRRGGAGLGECPAGGLGK